MELGGFPQTPGPAVNVGLGHLPGWRETVGFLPGGGCCARARPPVSGHGVLGARPHSCWHLWAWLVACWVLVGDPALQHHSPRDADHTARSPRGRRGAFPPFLTPTPSPLNIPHQSQLWSHPLGTPGLWQGPPGTLGFVLQVLWAPPSSPGPVPGACARGRTPRPLHAAGVSELHSRFLQLDPVPPPAQTPSI